VLLRIRVEIGVRIPWRALVRIAHDQHREHHAGHERHGEQPARTLAVARRVFLVFPVAHGAGVQRRRGARQARFGQADVVGVAQFGRAQLRERLVDARGEDRRVAGLRTIGMQPALQPALVEADGVVRDVGREAEHAVRIGIGIGEQHLLEVEARGLQQHRFRFPELGGGGLQRGRRTGGDFDQVDDARRERPLAQPETLARRALQREGRFQDLCGG
jgi:hypothetical protein